MWYMGRKYDNEEGYSNWAHPFPRVWEHKRGSDITEGDATEVRVSIVKVFGNIHPSTWRSSWWQSLFSQTELDRWMNGMDGWMDDLGGWRCAWWKVSSTTNIASLHCANDGVMLGFVTPPTLPACPSCPVAPMNDKALVTITSRDRRSIIILTKVRALILLSWAIVLLRATAHMSQEPWPWSCESPKESV